jgi:RHS repeat-associated protein
MQTTSNDLNEDHIMLPFFPTSTASRRPDITKRRCKGKALTGLRAVLLSASTVITLCVTAAAASAQARPAVTPDGVSLSIAAGATSSYQFKVTNTGNASGTFLLTKSCTGAAVSCSFSGPTTITLGSQAFNNVTVTYSGASGGGTGTVALIAHLTTSPFTTDSGYANLTVTPNYAVVDPVMTNNDLQDVSACAASCFDATYAQSTVPYYSMGAPRNVTLVYRGDRIAGKPFIHVDVSLDPGAPTVQKYQLAAAIGGQPVTFLNGETVLNFTGSTQQVRLGGQVDASSYSTGMYPLQITVTTLYVGGGSEQKTLSSNLLVVNERQSGIARGWTVAGVQRLYAQADGSALITDGNGSGTYFATVCAACTPATFTSPNGDFSTLTRSGTGANTVFTRASVDSTKATFNNVGQLTGITDRFGNRTGFLYDGQGRLTKVEDPFMETVRACGIDPNTGWTLYCTYRSGVKLTYGTYGLTQISDTLASTINEITLGAPRITYVTVSSDSTLRVIKDPDGDSTAFAYDGTRRLSAVVNRRGDSTTFTYDSLSGKLSWVDLPRVTLYNGAARPRVTYAPWQTVGVPTTSTAGTAATSVLTSTVRGATTDALGRAVSFSADHWGQPLSVTDPIGRTTTITRNGGFFPSSVQYAEGGVDNFTFAGALLTSQTLAGQTATNIHYGAYGQPDTISGTGRPTVNASLGPGGRVEWLRLGGQDSLRVSYTYDSRGRLLTQTDSLGHTTTFHYDALFGNLDSTLAPGNRYTKLYFDGYGRDSTQQSNNEPQRQITYDALNRVLQVNDGVNPSPTRYGYDKLFLIRVQDAKGQVYRVDKNALGWTTRRYDPADTLNRYDSYTYESTGRLHSWTNRRGQQINYTYDALDRLVSKSGTNTSTDSLAYSTDGKIAVMWNAVERDSVFRDSTGWVTSVVTRVSGQRFQITYRPNNIQQIDTVLISGGGITFAVRHYGWNRTIGTLDTISVNGTLTRFVRNKDLLPTQTIWPSLTRTDAWTAIHSVSQSTFSVPSVDTALSRRYSYDSRFGMQDYITLQSSNYRTRQRTYDGLRRLSGLGDDVYASASCGSDPASGYLCPIATQSTVTFDAVGNRADAPDTMYTTGNRMTRFNGYTYAYDLDGNDTNKVNIATGDRKSYEWSGDGLLNRVLVNGVEKVRFEYNAGGQLVRRWTNGTLDRTYLWDGGQLLAELNATANQRLSEYAYSPGADLPFAMMTGATSITATRYHLIDEVGNVIGVMNGSSIDEQISYDDWGVATTIGNTDNQLLFKGLLWEPDAGLYYMRARWYDPGPGRFISEDPIGIAGGINQYAFVNDDPVNASDPSGQWKLKNFLKSLLQAAPIAAFAVIGGSVGYAAAAKTLSSTLFGSAVAAGVEHLATGTNFWQALQRNFDISSAHLALSPLWAGKIIEAGADKSSAYLRGYVINSRNFGGLTLGAATVLGGVDLTSTLAGQTFTTYAQHEFGHVVQFIGLSAFKHTRGLGPWIPYVGLGLWGLTGEIDGWTPLGGCLWEEAASIFGMGRWGYCGPPDAAP